MSRYSGPQSKGATRKVKQQKREEAETRNKHYRDNLELQEKMANSESVREGAITELVSEME